MDLGNKIRELRIRKGYSQENMADLLSMSTTNYSYIEQGKVNLNMKKLEQIADVLDSDVFEIMCLGEKNVFYIQDNKDNSQSGYIVNQNLPQNYQKLSTENEKMNREIDFLKEKVSDSESIISLLRSELTRLSKASD